MVDTYTPGYNPRISFDASPTVEEFILDNAFVTGIMGPLGSGKSVGAVAKLGRLALLQKPGKDFVRHSRWAVIRNTYPELRTTTIKTWQEIFDEAHCGPIKWSHPITHHIRRAKTSDVPGLDMEVIFLALDKPQDIKHLKSLDLTGAWVNEAMEVPYEIVDMLTARVGRYPQMADGGATWAGIFMDTNACDDTNWWYEAAESGVGIDLSKIVIPGIGDMHIDLRWQFFRQPPAVLECQQVNTGFEIIEPGFPKELAPPDQVIESAARFWYVNPGAENLKYLRPGYYHQQLMKKTHDWIQRFMQSKYVYMVDGKPWIPEYSDEVMSRDLTAMKDVPLLGGIDCGGGTLNPAAVIGQRGMYGDWRVLFECSLFDIGIERFSEVLHAGIARDFPGLTKPRFWIDPAGRGRDEVYEIAVQDHLRSRGFDIQLAPTNATNTRREALALPMTRNIRLTTGVVIPGFLVNKCCKKLRAGLAGKWFRRKMVVSGTNRYVEKPEKNEWSHVCEAAGYMTLGGGEHAILTRGRSPKRQSAALTDWATRTHVVTTDFDPYA